MSTYYLISYDIDYVFKSSDSSGAEVHAKFDSVKNIRQIVNYFIDNPESVKEIFFYNDDDQDNPSKFGFHSKIHNYNWNKIHGDLEYYLENPDDFVSDLENNSGLDQYLLIKADDEEALMLAIFDHCIKNDHIENFLHDKDQIVQNFDANN